MARQLLHHSDEHTFYGRKCRCTGETAALGSAKYLLPRSWRLLPSTKMVEKNHGKHTRRYMRLLLIIYRILADELSFRQPNLVVLDDTSVFFPPLPVLILLTQGQVSVLDKTGSFLRPRRYCRPMKNSVALEAFRLHHPNALNFGQQKGRIA